MIHKTPALTCKMIIGSKIRQFDEQANKALKAAHECYEILRAKFPNDFRDVMLSTMILQTMVIDVHADQCPSQRCQIDCAKAAMAIVDLANDVH